MSGRGYMALWGAMGRVVVECESPQMGHVEVGLKRAQ